MKNKILWMCLVCLVFISDNEFVQAEEQEWQFLKGQVTAKTAAGLISETARALTAEGHTYRLIKTSEYNVTFVLDKPSSSEELSKQINHWMLQSNPPFLGGYIYGGDLRGGPVLMRIMMKPVTVKWTNPYERNPVTQSPEPRKLWSKLPIVLPKDYVKNYLSKPEEAYADSRSIPVFKDNRPNGMQFSNIKKGGLWDTLGIRDGDIIQQFNGIDLDMAATMTAFYDTISGNQPFQLTIVRNGARKIQKYEVQ